MKARSITPMLYFALTIALFSGAPRSWGYTNPIEGGSTETVTNIWSLPFILQIGRTSPDNSLIVTNGGQVYCIFGTIGVDHLSDNNTAMVTGSGSIWSNRALTVGLNGAGNALTIADGGQLYDTEGYIGYYEYSSNNTALVTGSGSAWMNSDDLHVGYEGSDNELKVEEGGQVNSRNGIIGYGYNAWPSNNSVLVTGAGSVWNNDDESGFADLLVGRDGWGSWLSIENGGQVHDDRGYIGYHKSSSNNTARVTGTGSAWNNSDKLHIGYKGSSNALTIADGGEVFSGHNSALGALVDSDDNTALVTGTGSAWESLGRFFVGLNGSSNSLMIADGGQIYCLNDTALGSNEGSVNNTVLVTGTGSVWEVLDFFHVGWGGSGNTLTIADGGAIYSQSGSIGNEDTADHNTVLVTGAESIWSNDEWLAIGYEGSDNQLSVTDFGYVYTGISTLIGERSSSSNNNLTVHGAGSVLDNGANTYVGWYGSGNSMIISNGGVVSNQWGYIGRNSVSDNNMALVTGAGSVWHNNKHLYVGQYGSGNTLRIENGGQAYNSRGFTLGSEGSGNTLRIEDGGQVECHWWGSIGASDGSDSNTVLVTGVGSVWKASGFALGGEGSGNTLRIENGGQVSNSVNSSGVSLVGVSESSSNNTVMVTGAGSVFDRFVLAVGNDGSGNTLRVEKGGLAHLDWCNIGSEAKSRNNRVTVAGNGTVFNHADLKVGKFGTGNTLRIVDGGRVSSFNGFIGALDGSSNNTARVSGHGSVWHMDQTLFLGGGYETYASNLPWVDAGPGNRLTVEDHGWVLVGVADTNLLPDIGSYGGIAVGGTNINYQETIGATYLNEMIVANGATVESDYGFIGLGSSETGTVTVTGSGSIWRNHHDLHIGSGLGGSILILTDNGMAEVGHNIQIRHHSSVRIGSGSQLTVAGRYHQHMNSELSMDVNAAAPSECGHLTVNGKAKLKGLLRIVLNGPPPVDTATFDLFDWSGGLSGSFTAIDLPVLTFGLVWNTSQLYTTGELSIEHVTVNTVGDGDGDGMADGWELRHFGGDISPSDNPDADFLNCAQEFIAGTDPTDYASCFALASTKADPAGFVVEWAPCVSNRLYTVYCSTNLADGFQALATGIEHPQSSYTDTVHAAESRGFYQVEVQMK